MENINSYQHRERGPEGEKYRKALKQFRESLRGWMTNEDADDFCPDCWGPWLKQTKLNEIRELIERDAKPTSNYEIAKSRKHGDAYFTECCQCGKEIWAETKE